MAGLHEFITEKLIADINNIINPEITADELKDHLKANINAKSHQQR